MILKRLFRRGPTAERSSYEAIVAAARHPVFYADWGVPDTLDGRFDMISLHAFLVLDRLKGVEEAFRQGLVDELFADMDRSLREMGVGDLSVGKKVRKMAEVFYGRVAAYDAALERGPEALEAAIARNVFPDAQDSAGPELLAAHVAAQRRHLAAQDAAAIAGGRINFKEPSP
jgi:cytochrome b pre-mRNA-processing protein 3